MLMDGQRRRVLCSDHVRCNLCAPCADIAYRTRLLKCEAVNFCKRCDCLFVVRYPNEPAIYCSDECARSHRSKVRMENCWRQCQNCYNIFLVHEKADRGLRCSRRCKKPEQTKPIEYQICRL